MKVQYSRDFNELLRRYATFIITLFVIALGTSLSIRANLGSSPISCPPYILSLVPNAPLSMGQYVICMHIFFILSQIILLRKDYQPIQLLQIGVSFLFGFYTDLTMWMTSYVQIQATTPLAYGLRFVELLVGGAMLAYGIAAEVHCNVLMLAGEGFPLAIAKVLKKDFGRVKICSDTGLVCVGIAFCYYNFGQWHWEMIGVGTLVSMFYVGYLVRKLSPHFNWLEKFFNSHYEVEHIQTTEADENPLVITIAREYGSGGDEVGKLLAQELNIKYYNRDIIDQTAAELGYSRDFVSKKEQNISTSRLWELIFTDKSIPEAMNPSNDDAIFVSESRTIQKIAHKNSCVIIGRCANWLLRDRPHCYNIYIYAPIQAEVSRIMSSEGLSEEAVHKKIEQKNRARANHYWKYTGQNWNDCKNYDLVINISRIGIEGAVKLIKSVCMK